MAQSRKQDLEEIFNQILVINSLRDFVVHNIDGSMLEFEDADPTKRYVSDSLRSSRTRKVKTCWFYYARGDDGGLRGVLLAPASSLGSEERTIQSWLGARQASGMDFQTAVTDAAFEAKLVSIEIPVAAILPRIPMRVGHWPRNQEPGEAAIG